MRCPFCAFQEDKVIDSRPSKDGRSIRRRRECQSCHERFTSYERIVESFPVIVKKDKNREEYDREKLQRGIKIACNKLPISTERIDEVILNIERKLIQLNKTEVGVDFLGTTVMSELRDVDPVAYIRFASVYREFEGIEEFLRELNQMESESEAE